MTASGPIPENLVSSDAVMKCLHVERSGLGDYSSWAGLSSYKSARCLVEHRNELHLERFTLLDVHIRVRTLDSLNGNAIQVCA